MKPVLDILSWIIGEIGTKAQRHTERAVAFIRDASLRAAKRKEAAKKK